MANGCMRHRDARILWWDLGIRRDPVRGPMMQNTPPLLGTVYWRPVWWVRFVLYSRHDGSRQGVFDA